MVFWKVPSKHELHWALPSWADTKPGWHGAHDDALMLSEKDPAGHKVHTVWFSEL